MTSLRVVRGTPDDEELAAVVAALSIVSARRANSRSSTTRPFVVSAWRAAAGDRQLPRVGAWRTLGRA